MQKKVLMGLTAFIALLTVLTGCPNAATGGASGGGKPGEAGAPAEPVFSKVQRGYELKDSVNLATVTADQTREPGNLGAVISLVWKPAEGAVNYDIYLAKRADGVTTEPPRPETPLAKDITDLWYFARDLDAESMYYFWVAAKNSKGTTLSAAKSQGTDIAGWQKADGGIERGDYPRDLTVTPGDGTLTVSWSLSDRVGWYEVYYTTDATLDPRVGEKWTGQPAGDNPGTIITGTPSEVIGKYGLKPYKFDDFFNQAHMIPWKGTAAGTPRMPAKFFGLKTTITGLQNGTTYYVWVRSPNANGERGFSYVSAAPANAPPADVLPAVTGVKASGKPESLAVSWNRVEGADSYRIYTSKYDLTPGSEASYSTADKDANSYTVAGLDGNFVYYVWVVAVKGNSLGAFGRAVKATTKPASGGPAGSIPDKVDLRGNVVKNIVYVEINDSDPRIAAGYVMENSNVQFFDYIILFAANLRNRDCDAEIESGETSHRCHKAGVHLHYNGNVQHILDNRDKYIKPLQDRGIKVLLGLLGDWGGVGFGTMGEWPMEDVFPWAGPQNGLNPTHAPYPYNKELRRKFLQEVKTEIERLGLDGVDFDDEWASANENTKGLAVYPSQANYYTDGEDQRAAWARCGVNYANLIADAREILGPTKTITVFEWQSARFITSTSGIYPDNKDVILDNKQPISRVHDYYDFITEAAYGSWKADGYNGTPHAKYAPIGIDICGGDSPSTPRPIISLFAETMQNYFMKAANPYGVNMYYALQSLAVASKPWPGQKYPKLWDSSRGRALTQAEYLSLASKVIYGENVIYIGPDYPQDWSKY
jgi:hypothetical protein